MVTKPRSLAFITIKTFI